MTKLTDSQSRLLIFAATAEDGTIGASDHPRTIDALLTRGLVIDVADGDGPRRLQITEAGRAALGSNENADPADCGEVGETPSNQVAQEVSSLPPARRGRVGALVALSLGEQTPLTSRSAGEASAEKAKEPKGKTAALVALLQRPEGATIKAMTSATGWQAHSVRGCLSGAIKKGLGLEIASLKTETGRVYRILGPAS